MVFDATKVVQAERNGKKKKIFLAFSEAQPILPVGRSQQGKLVLFCNMTLFFFNNLKKMSTFAFSKIV